MKKTSHFFVFCIFILTSGVISFATADIVHADTIISAQTIPINTVWDKSGSPYILRGLVTFSGGNLTIGPGVQVIGDKSDPDFYPGISVIGGKLLIEGNHVERTSLKGLWNLNVNNGTFDLDHADISNFDSMNLTNSTGTMATSTFSDSRLGIQLLNSHAVVLGSRIAGMERSFTVRDYIPKVFPVANPMSADMGDIGNALSDSTSSSPLYISNSSIMGSSVYALKSYSTKAVDVRNNWWGSSDGPLNDGAIGNSISGLISDEPVLTSEPAFDPEENNKACCSSILFIPGIEGSRLYRNESMPLGLGTITNKLWEPNTNNDVKKLFMDPLGSSTDPNIYSGGAIDKALGLKDIYGKFLAFLDGMVASGSIGEWKVFGYDWRKPIAEVVAGNEKKATTTESLVQVVGDLASRSKTGKVTIIAHSNGGLVAKYLVKALDELGKPDLIDKVISVAVPYLGTPQAIASLLHGDGQSFGYGWLMNEVTARQLGQNMASAYSLLPSAEYFKSILGPTIAFASSTTKVVNGGSYPIDIRDASGQAAFITDSNNLRRTAQVSDLNTPIKGNSALMAAASILHGLLDPMEWPKEIVRYAIVGWNNSTIKEIVYGSKTKCIGMLNCKPVTTHVDEATNMGDGTVIAPSAAFNGGQVGSIDLDNASQADKTTIDHSTILESKAAQTMIENAVTADQTAWCDKISKIPGVTCGEPDYSKDRGRTGIVVSTHSPVELHAYDKNGNHTGIIPPTAEMIKDTLAEGDTLDDMVLLYENKIPGAHFDLKHEGDNGDTETTIELPDDGNKYRLEIAGTGVGTFEYDVDRYNDNVLIGHAEYDNIPVTPITLASTSVQYLPIDQSATSTITDFAASTTPLLVDFDGDGSTDAIATSSAEWKPINSSLYFQSMKKTLIALLGQQSAKAKAFLKRLDRLETLINKGKDKKIKDLSARIEKRIGHLRPKSLSDKDKQTIADMIDAYLAQYE